LAAELAPSGDKVIMAVEDQTTFSAGHGVFCDKSFATAIASWGKGSRRQAKTETDTNNSTVSTSTCTDYVHHVNIIGPLCTYSDNIIKMQIM
jgi:hypothetical protein